MDNTTETAIFAGGCFWCTEAVFKRIDGVLEVLPGYIGGKIKNPCYREVAMGITGHAEAVKIDYDAEKVSYEFLLEVFFATHDPTTLNKQGADVGTQYRSEIFCINEEQKEKATAFIAWLTKEKIFRDPIVTKVSMASPFYLAEDYHFNYYDANKSQPYCQLVINPKINKLQSYYSDKLK
ncbi:peptide-methionine (S)-S-oxide reductase MsrA [Neptunitalea lumnitzerae]|uniref:Peptide methionine sulfoxide reductase MsrA n=1 Tax=Neptunitalea lumnitzerae TaxID=2965509 RepID=A0ABQ5MJX6_9FLAO|nr:peptide-methionine (S)-S-oxide reductase MsrA [Neptunitalea sp. Y10]GLB49710.1 peptide methionine sulfoxide reductase MsrA [Neptunitalea sp. Y10]